MADLKTTPLTRRERIVLRALELSATPLSAEGAKELYAAGDAKRAFSLLTIRGFIAPAALDMPGWAMFSEGRLFEGLGEARYEITQAGQAALISANGGQS